MKFKDIASLIEEDTDKKNILAGLDKMSTIMKTKVYMGVVVNEESDYSWSVDYMKESFNSLNEGDTYFDRNDMEDLSFQEFTNKLMTGEVFEFSGSTDNDSYKGIISINKEALKQEAMKILNLDELAKL